MVSLIRCTYFDFGVVRNRTDSGRSGRDGDLPDPEAVLFHWMGRPVPLVCHPDNCSAMKLKGNIPQWCIFTSPKAKIEQKLTEIAY